MTPSDYEMAMARLELVARTMDSAILIPGTDIRVGLDAVVGLVPGIGDAVSAAVSSYLIWEARKLGAPKWLIARMVGNTLVDAAVGSIPVLGDAFDVAFRANVKNMALLRRHLARRGPPRDPLVIEGRAIEID